MDEPVKVPEAPTIDRPTLVETLVIDPNKLFREGLKLLVHGAGFHLAHEAATLTDAEIALEAGLSPDLVVVEPFPHDPARAEQMQRLWGRLPMARLVLLTDKMDAGLFADALHVRIDGYLMKALTPASLCRALHLIMEGERIFPTDLAALLLTGRLPRPRSGVEPGDGGLSPRETQILHYLVNAEPNKSIANQLGITEATVKVHLKSLLRKINATNRTQAAIWALDNGYDAVGRRDSA